MGPMVRSLDRPLVRFEANVFGVLTFSRRLTRLLVVAVVPALIVYIGALFFGSQVGIKPVLVLRDLMQTCDQPMVVGMISSFGYLLWAASATICLFVCFSGLVVSKSWRQFLILGGVFSGVLCIDDLFLLHDRHVGQEFIYITYAVMAVIILIRFRDLIAEVNGVSFLAAVVLLGLSVISDRLQIFFPDNYPTVQIFEEGFKFMGIACWLAFWSQASGYASKLRGDKSG